MPPRGWVSGVCLAAGVIAAATPARGDTPDARIGVAIGMGTTLLGEDAMSSIGVEPEAGVRLGPVLALAHLGAMNTTIRALDPDASIDGRMYQYGVSARGAVHTLEMGGGAFELWVEGGWLRRQLYWDAGGALRRDGVTAAVGFDGEGRLGDEHRPHRITFGLGVRAGWFGAAVDGDSHDPSMEMFIRVGWQR